MATYSDPMLGYADHYSTGRYFALAGAASALTGASLVYASAGHIHALVHTSAELALAAMAEWSLLGFGLLMAIAVLGSLLITKRAKQTITVSQVGVLSKAPRKELFLAREEMLGMAEIPGRPTPRGTLLVTADPGRQLFIPRWIGGYGACLEEIRNLGVPALPPYRPSGTQTIAGWLSWLVVVCGVVLVVLGARVPAGRTHQWMVLGGSVLVWIAATFRMIRRYWIELGFRTRGFSASSSVVPGKRGFR